ncbi:hypothetical protein ACT6P6_02080 [Priestia endophytica]
MREIGSEFWLEYTNFNSNPSYAKIPDWLQIGKDNKLLLSGRSSIDYILRDIKLRKSISKVYFPSYCCQSMIQPFIDNNISVEFYEVYYDGELQYQIDLEKQCDIFFAMNYFGFSDKNMDYYIENFKNRGSIVIEDVTHSLLSQRMGNTLSDYLVASLRKWFPIVSGGLASKNTGNFSISLRSETLKSMIKVKEEAMTDKAKYMNGDYSINKNLFLEKFNEANSMLGTDYALYPIDYKSLIILSRIDIEQVKLIRRRNAISIYNSICSHDISKIFKPLFKEVKDGDCPLFVPFMADKHIRDELRKFLISNNIYCPIHWERPPSVVSLLDDIYTQELSIISDQRYTSADMDYLTNTTKSFFKEFGL